MGECRGNWFQRESRKRQGAIGPVGPPDLTRHRPQGDTPYTQRKGEGGLVNIPHALRMSTPAGWGIWRNRSGLMLLEWVEVVAVASSWMRVV
jgi:hypothetical protein